MAQDVVLAIDNGTQSVRALLFDMQGNLLDKSRVIIEPYFSKHPGWAEQHANYFWQSLCQACQQLWEITDIPKAAIKGVAVTTQRGTVINLDENGQPLRPAMIWLDQRRTEGLDPVSGLWGLAFKLARVSDTVAYLQAEAEANWIYTHQRDIWERTHKYVLLSGYLNYRLTGRLADSVGSTVAYLPFDYKRQTWSSPRDWKWQAVAVKPEHLPELVPPAQTLGDVTPEAAQATGLPAGLPVIAAAADKACEVIGAGCLEPHIGCLSYGTTATINTTHRRYIEVIPILPPYPAAVPDAYSLEVQVFRGYWMVSWFKREFGQPEMTIAEELGIEPESLFDELVNQVPPGSMGLVLQPYWTPGAARAGAGGARRDHRLQRRAHARPRLPRDPRRAGLCAARRQRTHRAAQRRADHRAARLRRRIAERRGHAAHRRYFRAADGPPTPLRNVRAGRGHRRGGRAGAASGFRQRDPGHDARWADVFEPDAQTHAIYDDLFRPRLQTNV